MAIRSPSQELTPDRARAEAKITRLYKAESLTKELAQTKARAVTKVNRSDKAESPTQELDPDSA